MSSLPTVIPMAPMLAKPLHRPGWVYEEKYDGWRMIAYKNGPAVRLVSRNGVEHTERFRELAAAVAGLKAPMLILEGEVCVFDKNLVSQFQLLDRSPPTSRGRRPCSWPSTACASTGSTCAGCRCTVAAPCSRERWTGPTSSRRRGGCRITGSRPGRS